MALHSRNSSIGLGEWLKSASNIEKGVIIVPRCPRCGSRNTKTLTRTFSTMVLSCEQCGESWIEDVRR